MKLNVEKSKVMVFNFTEQYQFATRLYLEDRLLDTIQQTKLLGTIIQSDLKWQENTDMLVKKAYQRMLLLHKLYSFNIADVDLVNIYVLYIRSLLEQNCQVWHYSITEEEKSDLERVQKVAVKIILQERYECYEQSLVELNLENLAQRRDKLCLKFAKKCLKHEQTKEMFPLNDDPEYDIRKKQKFYVQFAHTNRLRDSTIPQLQRVLNSEANK